MSKLLIIDVGDGGRRAIRMKEAGIPNANYIKFKSFGDWEETRVYEILYYNLYEMNGRTYGWPTCNSPKLHAELAENVKGQIRGIIENNFNKDANGLISKDATASIDGLYLVACVGDNHTFYALYKYRKGERFWTYFEGEYERTNGWFCGKPINIVNIVLEADTEWKQGEIAPCYGLYIVACTFQNAAEAHYGYHASYGITETKQNVQYDKKNYALIYVSQGDKFLDILAKSRVTHSNDNEINWENINILSYYIIRDDTYRMKK